MSILMVCAVRDAAVSVFGTPFTVIARGAAVRGFTDEVRREGSTFFNHPQDYDLYQLGTYDEDSGLLAPLDAPDLIIRGVDASMKLSG